MKKEDLVIGNKYNLDTLEVEFVGMDQEHDDRVLLNPLNAETKEFYSLSPNAPFSLGVNTFMLCYNPK